MLVNMNFQNLANYWLVAQPPDNQKPGQKTLAWIYMDFLSNPDPSLYIRYILS